MSDNKSIHYGPDGSKIGESRKSGWDDSKTIHYGPDGSKAGESWAGVGAGAAGRGELVGAIVLGALVLFLLVLILMDRFPVLELGVEIILYICAFLYFIKRIRHKRTGNEADKPSKFLKNMYKDFDRLGHNLLGLIRTAFCHCNL